MEHHADLVFLSKSPYFENCKCIGNLFKGTSSLSKEKWCIRKEGGTYICGHFHAFRNRFVDAGKVDNVYLVFDLLNNRDDVWMIEDRERRKKQRHSDRCRIRKNGM